MKESVFNILPIIEQKPFENPTVRSFFAKWCGINSSIYPLIIGRNDWEQKSTKGILEKKVDGKQTLYLPKDLQLWEMVRVMEAVDHDTFATKPERRDEAKKKLIELGKTFENAGVYIAQRLNFIDQGKDIAQALAEEFYGYGQSLVTGRKPERSGGIGDIASRPLTPQEIETIDHFLAGDILYESRRVRVQKKIETDPDKKDESYEAERRKTLAQFFKASATAFTLTNPRKISIRLRIKNWPKNEMYSNKNQVLNRQTEVENIKSQAWANYQKFLGKSNLSPAEQQEKDRLQNILFTRRPWRSLTPAHAIFLTKITKAISRQIEEPIRKLDGSIFRRGMEMLQQNMPFDKLPDYIKNSVLHQRNSETTLREALQIDKLKIELELIRKTGDKDQISAQEREITDIIQNAVTNYPYKQLANNPSEIIANQQINCVGASLLGGTLMQEAGLDYLVIDIPNHSLLLLVTSDGHVEWRDMQNASINEDISDDVISGINKDSSPLTVADIAAVTRQHPTEGLMFYIKRGEYRDKLPWAKDGQIQPMTAYNPEYGLQIQILNNTGIALSSLGRHEEAIIAHNKTLSINPQCSYSYNSLGNHLRCLKRYTDAIEAYRHAITIDPEHAFPYNGLGNTLYSLKHWEQAIEAYRQSIAFGPEHAFPYNGLGNALLQLGQNNDALIAYHQSIALDPDYPHPYYGLGNTLRVLSRDEEAIQAYQKFIKTAEKEKYDYSIKRAKRIISEFQKHQIPHKASG